MVSWLRSEYLDAVDLSATVRGVCMPSVYGKDNRLEEGYIGLILSKSYTIYTSSYTHAQFGLCELARERKQDVCHAHRTMEQTFGAKTMLN